MGVTLYHRPRAEDLNLADVIMTSLECNGTITLENDATITNSSAGDVELTADNTSTSGRNAWQVDARVSGACTGSSRAGYFHVTNTNAVAITGELTGLEAKVRSSSSDTTSVKGIHVSIDAKAQTITTGRGIEISIDAGESEHGGITTAQGLRIAHNSSGAHTTITGMVIEGPGTWTSGIDLSGGTMTTDIILQNSETISNATDGRIAFSGPLRVSGTDILDTYPGLTIWCDGETAAANGIWTTVKSTITSGDVTGIRGQAFGNAAGADGAQVRGGYFEAKSAASKYAGMLEGLLAHVDVEDGDVTVAGDIRGLTSHISTGSSLEAANLYGIIVNIQTRGDESITTDDVGIRINNEAYAGNGREMDSAIQIVDTYVNANGFGYGIDMSGAVIGTADILLQNGESIKNTTDGTIEYSGFMGVDLTTQTVSANFTIDWRTGNFQKVDVTGERTATFTAPGTTGKCTLIVVQGDGSDLITWPGTVLWPGNVAPTLSTGNAEVDIITFYWDGTNYFGVANYDFS